MRSELAGGGAINTSRAPRVLSICADDFGLTLTISRGIAELARLGRVTAVSCLTTDNQWAASAPLLADVAPSVDRGLHFNLTEGSPISPELRRHWSRFPSLTRLIATAHIGRLPLVAIACELRAQWQRFAEATGMAPRFVDGHQHVHHLPGVRECVLAALANSAAEVAVRNTGCVIGPGNPLKRMLIERTGGLALQRQLRRKGIAHNRALLGVYDFGQADYGRCMQRWLLAAPDDGGLLLCHPAAADTTDDSYGAGDPIAAARLREAAYLRSAAFDEDLSEAKVTLGCVWQRSSSTD